MWPIDSFVRGRLLREKAVTGTQVLDYGVTDTFLLGFGAGYKVLWQGDIFGGGTAKGFVNPRFGAAWRAIEQGECPVNGDIVAHYSPNIVHNDLALYDFTASGRQSADLAILASRVMRALTVQTFANAQYLGRAKNEFETRGAFWSFGVGANGQARLTDDFFVNASLWGTKSTAATVGPDMTPPLAKFSFAPTASFSIAPGYHLIQDRLILSGRYQHSFIGDTTYSAPGNGFAAPSTEFYKNQSENLFSIHMIYLFP